MIRPGAVTRAAAICHCCRAERGGRLILHTAYKKRTASLQCSEEQFSAPLCWCLSRCCSSEGGHGAAPCRLCHSWEGQLESVSHSNLGCPGMWCGPCAAGGEEHDGSTAGGLPPASLLLKGRAVAVGLATAGCSPGGPALIAVLHCLCSGSLEPAWISLP